MSTIVGTFFALSTCSWKCTNYSITFLVDIDVVCFQQFCKFNLRYLQNIDLRLVVVGYSCKSKLRGRRVFNGKFPTTKMAASRTRQGTFAHAPYIPQGGTTYRSDWYQRRKDRIVGEERRATEEERRRVRSVDRRKRPSNGALPLEGCYRGFP